MVPANSNTQACHGLGKEKNKIKIKITVVKSSCRQSNSLTERCASMCFQIKGGRAGPVSPELMSGSPEYKVQVSMVWAAGHPHSSASYFSSLQGGALAKEPGDL